MSYYITTHEIPADLLEKLKKLSPDDDKMQQLFYEWEKSNTKVSTTNVMEAPYRAISSGKYSSDYEPEEHEIRFYKLVNTEANMPKRERRYLSEGYPGISDYEEAGEVALIWKATEKVIALHPEYAVTDLLATDTFSEIQACASEIDEYIRFYYGCAMRGSATITIDS